MADQARPGTRGPDSTSAVPAVASRRLPGPLLLWVGLGGAAGVLLNSGTHALLDGAGRALLGPAAGTTPGMAAANLLGAFLLGLLHGRARTAAVPWDPRITAGLGTGLLGAYTSFSALAALLGTPVAAAWAAGPTAFGPAQALGAFVSGLLLVVALAVTGTLCARAGLRVGSAR